MGAERNITAKNVSLPPTQKDLAEQQARQRKFSAAGDNIPELIPREQRALAREELERKLLEGLNSGPATAMTPEDWKELRESLRKCFASRES